MLRESSLATLTRKRTEDINWKYKSCKKHSELEVIIKRNRRGLVYKVSEVPDFHTEGPQCKPGSTTSTTD